MKRLIYLFSVCMLAIMTACTEEPTVTTGSITGMVTDASDGVTPISGVNVSIPSLGESTTTGANGSFTFSDLESGNHTVVFTKSGYDTEQRTASVVAGQSSSINVQMQTTEKKAEIELNPTSLNFGTNQTDMSVTITNNGNSNAEWSINLGNNNWLSVSEMAGSIQPKRTQSVVFTVDRNFLSEQKTVVVNFHAFGNSYPLTISCAPGNATSEMSIDPKTLDFGTNDTEKNITIRNTGTSPLNWTATDLTEKSVTLSAMEGTVAAGGNSVVKVMLDRSELTGPLNTTFTIMDGVKAEVISVSANGGGGGGGEMPSDIVETKGLRAYFTFNGNLDDLAENSLYGFVNPEATYVNGVVSGTQALSFSRKDETTFTVNDGLIDRTSMSVCFWIKDVDEGNIFWVNSSNETLGNTEMMYLSYTNGHLRYVMERYKVCYWSYDSFGFFTHKAIDDGEWHHIALVSDFNNQKADYVTTTLYIDGVKMDTLSEEYEAFNEKDTSTRHFDTGVKFNMGGKNTPNMQIANLRSYTRKLTEDQVKTIFEAKQ